MDLLRSFYFQQFKCQILNALSKLKIERILISGFYSENFESKFFLKFKKNI